jgi:putative hydrolase of the HAD superfamily
MKKTLFFDLGNVLIFFDHKKMCSQVAHLSGLDEKAATALMQLYGDPYERGAVDSRSLHEEICKQAPTPPDFAALMHAMSDIFKPNTPVISLALKLKQQGHPLFLLSNTCEAHFAFARSQFDFLNHFDGYILSYEVGARKPETEIFNHALKLAGCAPHDCFYTDDVLPYVESARSLNIDAEQYTHPEALIGHLSSRGFI